MVYYDQWRALAGRIRGVCQAAHLYGRFLAIRSSDSYGMTKELRRQVENILGSLKDFRSQFEHYLPSSAMSSLGEFIDQNGSMLSGSSVTEGTLQERVWAALVRLGAFEAELSFLLSDTEELIHARSELAFSHLQRLIVVDVDVKQKWQAAFAEGEVQCEKLGALHLLQQGIWAFKVDAAGARTD